VWRWLLHVLGLDNASGPLYLFPSGWGSILIPPLLTAVPIVWVLLRRHNCHTRGCLRIGRHKVPGTEFICCARHTPGGAPTHEDVIKAHHAARRRHQDPGESGERMHAEPEQVRCENSAAEISDAQPEPQEGQP
jgi:hypothetical protein